jgi:hypothetical protein
MDRHPRLLRSVAAFPAPAEWPAAWSPYTTTGCAINSLSGKFAVGHNRRSERYPRDAADAIGGQSSAPVAESSFTGARANSHKKPLQVRHRFRDKLGGPPDLPRLWHRLGPRDMRFKAKRSGHAAVTVP